MQIIKNSLQIILQGAPDSINADEIYSQLLSLDFVREVHGLHIWSVSSTEVFLSCHLMLAKGNGTIETDGLIRRINTMLEKDFGITHTTIQIEYSDVCDPASDSCCR